MKNIKNIILGIVAIFGVSSCSDFLDKQPLDEIGNDSYWKTATDLENYVVQFYTNFTTYTNVTYTGIFLIDGSYGSDDVIIASPNTTLNGSRSVVNSASSSVQGDWVWSNIRSVNIFFDNYQNCEDDLSLYSQFLGEAHFFRAFFYFDKVKAYGDAPWFESELAMDSEDLFKARDSRTYVVDKILEDLDKAIEYLDPISTVDGGTNRLSKEAALQFKSRVALFEGSWQKYHAGTEFGTTGADPSVYFQAAVNAAEELMSGNYSVGLYGSDIESYDEMFGLDDMSSVNEILLWKDYDKSISISHDSQVYVTSRTNSRSATFEFIESFLSNTGTPINYREIAKTTRGNDFLTYLADNCDPRLKKTIWTPGDLFWNSVNGYQLFTLPYIGQTGEYLNTTGLQIRKGVNVESDGAGGFYGGNCETGAIVFRYAEVLLNYAEAKYELDGNVDYEKSLNLLRRRVGMPDFDKTLNDPYRDNYADYGYTISDELHEIRRERRVELGQEGFRNLDYRRWAAHNLFQNKRPLGYPLDESEFVDGTQFPSVDETTTLLDPFASDLPNGYQFDETRDYLFCIPTDEITLNSNLTQNPGW